MKIIFRFRLLRYSLLVFATICLIGVTYIGFALKHPLQVPPEGMVYEIKAGMNLIRVMNDLAGKNIVSYPRSLLWYARITGQANRIKLGEYQLEPGIDGGAFLEKLFNGKVLQYSVTVVEGWTFQQMLEVIQTHEAIHSTLKGLSDKAIMDLIGYPDKHPEGMFFPDTYHFQRGTSDTEILQRAYQAMQDILLQEWELRDLGVLYKTPYEALIMASIVEKETGLPSERKAIAGVFSRRLEKRMRLQSDPTIIYGMGKEFDGNIRRRDLRSSNNPYNTYHISALPPTPIAMPGREAIHATLHPDEGDSLYFVSRGDGSHHFSSSLDEHNEAVIHYQLKGQRKPFSTFKPDQAPQDKP